MILRIPSFSRKSGTPKTPSLATRNSWQQSGQTMKRSGVREHGAATSISNVGRAVDSDGRSRQRGVSSIHRVEKEKDEVYAGGIHTRTTDPFTKKEQRQADERRHEYVRRLVKERKAKERDAQRRKKKGLLF